jgi:DNA-binding NtrC family response regulator
LGGVALASVLVIHHDSTIRTILEALIKRGHTTETARHIEAGVKQLRKHPPDVVVVGQDAQKKEGERLLRYMKDNNIKVPVVVVVSRGGAVFHQMMLKLGARGFLEYPIEQARLNDTIAKAMGADPLSDQKSHGLPAITPEELTANLSRIESDLNTKMKCFAGRNQVYISIKLDGKPTRLVLQTNSK